MGLAGLMIRILAKDDHLDFVEGCMVEGRKDVGTFGIADVLLALGYKELLELGEIGSLELRLQHLKPGGMDAGIDVGHKAGLLEESVVHQFFANGGGIAVARKNHESVVEGEQLGAQTLHQQIQVAPREVGTANRSTEERIASDDHLLIMQHKGH